MKPYDHKKIEKKWQKTWTENKVYKTLSAKQAIAKKLKPYYVLDMFPYPSGAGLHVGHPRGYIASDVFARMKRMSGFNVLHPMGFDSFGLPAEQYAIKTGKNPGPFTNQLVKRYKEQLSILGFSYDWDRQVATHDPEYYRWTQWIFLQIYNSWYDKTKQKARPITDLEKEFVKNGNEKVNAVCDQNTPVFSKTDWKNFSDLEKQNMLMKYRLAYEGYAEVNWCAEMGTVLANDEVIEVDGKMVSERGEFPVEKKSMRQWFMRITAYADRLIEGLETIDWSNSIKEIQRNWIGKSEGSEIEFILVPEGFSSDEILTQIESVESIDQEAKQLIKNIQGKITRDFQDGSCFMSFDTKYELAFREYCEKSTEGKGFIFYIKNNILYFGFKKDGGITFVDCVPCNYKIICDTYNELLGKTSSLLHEDIYSILFTHNNLTRYFYSQLREFDRCSVFTTRADTLFGVTYLVLAPENAWVEFYRPYITNWDEVEQYIASVKSKSDEDRVAAKEKTGIQLEGIFAVNPANNEQVPVWIADYVLAGYGTGAVMAVPAHDERDFEFAKKYDLPVKQVIARPAQEIPQGKIFRRDGTVSIVENDKNEILILVEKNGAHLFPQGGIEKGEDIIDSAKREVLEESGYCDLEFVNQVAVTENFFEMGEYGTRHRITHCIYFKLKSEKNVGQNKEEGDDIKYQVIWLPRSEVVKKVNLRNHPELFNIFLKGTFCFEDFGVLVDSGEFSGMTSEQAREAIIEHIGGKLVTKYKMRDAIFARQRYWGEPIPLVHENIKVKAQVKFSGKDNEHFDRLKKGIKNIEVRALDNAIRKAIKVGDVLEFINKQSGENFYTVVKDLKKYKTIAELYNQGSAFVENLFPGEVITSVEDLYNRYAKVAPGYEKTLDKFGVVSWTIEKVEGSIIKEVPEKQLPLTLPNVKSYEPSGNGEGPLATVKSWVIAGYETNTMPGWAGSSWYFLRYTDPTNKKKFADESELDYWFGKNGGVNMYVGGAEHATGHLLYSRFWHKVLKDLGYVKTEEPFQALRNQGMIGGADGRKMSKRWGNVINPDDVVRDMGADTLRVYESFMGPFDAHLPWSIDGIAGARRFIERIWRFQTKVSNTVKTTEHLEKVLHKTIKKVSEDIQNFAFNTAVSSMMIFANELEKSESINTKDWKKFLQILAPFAPHITDELWASLGEKKSIHSASWPTFDAKKVIDTTSTIGIQINGKVRAEIEINREESPENIQSIVLAMPEIIKWIDGKEIKKFIYVPGRVINIVI